jgi:hypothetical protein
MDPVQQAGNTASGLAGSAGSGLASAANQASANLPSIGTIVHGGLLESFQADATGDLTHLFQPGGALMNVAEPLQTRLTGLINTYGSMAAQGVQISGQIQSYVADLLNNGITFENLSPQDITSALKSIAPMVNTLGTVPRVAMSVGLSAASGFAMGGPVGALIGAGAGAAQAVYSDFIDSNKLKLSPPSSGAQDNLQRLINYGANKAYGLVDPLGWHYYDMIAREFREETVHFAAGKNSEGQDVPASSATNRITPICTPWLFGKAVTNCDPSACFTSFVPGMTKAEWQSKALDEIGRTAMIGQLPVTGDPANKSDLYTIAIGRRIPPHFYDIGNLVGFAFGTDFGSAGCGDVNPGGHMFTMGGGGPTTPMASKYGYLYALGTVHAMIAGGASDQAISSELILQARTLYLQRDQQFDPKGVEATSLVPLINWFLAQPSMQLDPSQATHPKLATSFQGANIPHLNLATSFQGAAVQEAIHSPAPQPLSPRAEQWCEFYLGNAVPPIA